MTYMATPQRKNLCLGGHEIFNFGRSTLGYHNYILSLSNLCLGVEKKIFKEIMHFYIMTYINIYIYLHKNPCAGGHEIYNFGRPSLSYLVCLIYAWEDFLRNTSIFHFLPLGGWGHDIYNFLFPYPTHATYQIILAQQFLRRCQCTTHDGRRKTTDANPQQQFT